jgi:hypothetical protein
MLLGSSHSILASRINPRHKVLDYMHECQALSSGKLSLVDTSLLPVLDKALPPTKIELKDLAKISVYSPGFLHKENTHCTT